jgi:hypothetical protein
MAGMNLYQKLIEVRKTCTFLKKDTQGFQFKYVSSSQILGALRDKMDELGLLLVPTVTGIKISDHTTAKDKHEYFTELNMKFTWVNAEKPDEIIQCDWYAQGLDDGEKGPGKAVTYAEKFFLLKFFNIPTDKSDPDANQKPPEKNKTTYNTPKPQPQNEERKPKGGYETCTPNQAVKLFSILHKPSSDVLVPLLRHLTSRNDITSTYQLTPKEADMIFDLNKDSRADLEKVIDYFRNNVKPTPQAKTTKASELSEPPEGFFDQPDAPDDGLPF